MAREDRHQEVLEGLLPYWRNPDAAWLLANSLYDWLPTRALALKWLLRTAAGCEPLDSVVIKMGSCYAHGFSTLVNRLLAYYWFLISAKAGSAESVFALGELELTGLSEPVDHLRALMWFTLAMAMTKDEELRERAQAARVELAKVLPIRDGVRACDLGSKWSKETG